MLSFLCQINILQLLQYGFKVLKQWKMKTKIKGNPYFFLLKEINLWNLLKAKTTSFIKGQYFDVAFSSSPLYLLWPTHQSVVLRPAIIFDTFKFLFMQVRWGADDLVVVGFFLLLFVWVFLFVFLFLLRSVFEAKLWTNDFYSLDVGTLKIRRSSPSFSRIYFFPSTSKCS